MINKMKKQSHIKGCIMKIGILGMLILAGIGFYSCDDITKGYLETDEAGYVTDTDVYKRQSLNGFIQIAGGYLIQFS